MSPLPAPSAADEPSPTSFDDIGSEHAVPTLERVYRTLAPKVLAYFRSHGMEPAEDLVGEVFIGVARGLAGFRGDDEALRRWVFTIARRRRVDEVRRRVLRRHVLMREPPDQPVEDRVEGMDSDLVAALRTLTSLQRDVVVMRFVADLSIEDVARLLRRPPGAIKALQMRALNQLGVRIQRPAD